MGDDDIMWSIQRRSVAKKKLKRINGRARYVDLWKLVSTDPILNEITVYGTLMSVSDGYLETKLPHPMYGFCQKGKGCAVNGMMRCRLCKMEYNVSLNAKGDCVHSGTWHASYSDCSKIACAIGLGTNIGKHHWSCCFATEYDSKCKK